VTVEVLDDRVCVLGEGPYYDELTGRMWWVDILSSRLLWRDMRTGDTGEVATTAHVGAVVPRRGGGQVLCLADGPVLADPDGSIRALDPYPKSDGPPLRSNDAKADPAGRLWLGTMAYDETPGAGALYRLDPGAAGPELVVSDVTISNGLGWSPDLTRMYYVDTRTNRIDVFDYDVTTGEPTNRRPFAELPSPDGLCMDASGAIWVALYNHGEVRRYLPDGTLDRVVEVGTPLVTSCAFAGPDLDQLVITTASGSDPGGGLTYVHRPGDVAGTPVDRYAG
jgi:sugar lactone lactonase YvrE